jgi:Tol biopolymer transport system component
LGWFISLTADEEAMYFAIYTPQNNAMDIYKSELVNGQYSQFEKLPDQINSTSKDATPCISPDESYIIFMSNRPGGYGGFDLYISYKKPDGTWTTAKNMGNKINSFSEEAMPLLSPEGKYLFFNSVKSGDLGFNPYWVDASFLCRSGDADNSGSIDISDVIYLINYLFKGGPAPELILWGDSNNDNNVSVSDVVYLINYLLKGGPKPSC